jgi:hypothetical protein
MPGMDEFICVPTETIPMKARNEEKREPKETNPEEIYGWSWDKNLDDFIEVVGNLQADGEYSRAEAVAYLIERCKRAEWKK